MMSANASQTELLFTTALLTPDIDPLLSNKNRKTVVCFSFFLSFFVLDLLVDKCIFGEGLQRSICQLL